MIHVAPQTGYNVSQGNDSANHRPWTAKGAIPRQSAHGATMVELVSTRKLQSPLNHDHVRLEGVVSHGRDKTQIVWFDLPSEFECYMSERGELWAVLLLPCAMVLGQDVRIDLPVDPLLLENLEGVQKIWNGWYNWAHQVRVAAAEEPDRAAPGGTAVCFSGGVDSYYSLIRLDKMTRETGATSQNHLLMLWGFDIPLSKPGEFDSVAALGRECAERFDSKFLPVATNLRELIGYKWQFDGMSHSAALASVGHLVSNKIRKVVIGSTHDFSGLIPWGSHPLVDPLFSTAATRIVHDGATVNRVAKTESICRVPQVLDGLRVCPRTRGRENCSKCSKCLRTMVTIDLFGQKDRARSFDWSEYSLNQVAKLYLSNTNEIFFAREIVEAARECGRADIAQAIQRSIRRSRLSRPLDWSLSKLSRVPHVWRYKDALRRSLLGYY